MKNAMQVIFPYRDHGVWMFDDESKGLAREPFVCGIPEMMDILVAGIENAEAGFNLYFSAQPFPGYRFRVDLVGPDAGGNWYKVDWNRTEMTGWLCPALFKFFERAPAAIYVKAEERRAGAPRPPAGQPPPGR